MSKELSQQLLSVLKTKKVFVFDFDGTIASTDEMLFFAIKKLCNNFGKDFTQQDYAQVKGKPSNEFYAKFLEIVGKDAVTDTKKVVKDFNQICEDFALSHNLECFSYVKKLAKTFSDKTFVVVSNNVKSFLEARLNQFELSKSFSNIFACGSDFENKKFVYERAESLLGAKPQDCALFEDDQKYINQAKEIGFLTVGILHDYNKDFLNADFFVEVE